MATAARTRVPVGPAVVIAVVAFFLGWGVLIVVQKGIDWLWVDSERPDWFVIGLPLVAALAVWAVRRFLGDDGHNPLKGIAISAYDPRQYANVILAILATLLGGLILGPEVALVSTGAVVGTVVAKMRHSDEVVNLASIGALAAILALFAGPLLSGESVMPDTSSFNPWGGILIAVPVSFVATVVILIARALGWGVYRFAGARVHLPALLGTALLVGVGSVVVRHVTGAPVSYIATSSEGLIHNIATETSVGLVLAVLAIKTLGYAASLGAGFRGGPFFPAMFIGAASGLLLALLLPDTLPMLVAIVAGLVGATIATAPMKWSVAVILGAAVGFVFASWAMVPAAVAAAIVARAIPRLEDRLARD